MKNKFSGRLTVRLSPELHRDLSKKADKDNVSLNLLVNYLLASAVKPKRKK